MCLYPRLIRNPKYKANKKNRGTVSAPNDLRQLNVPTGCGKCLECLKKKGREWAIRLNEEVRENNNGVFVTLTFNEESLKALKAEVYKTRAEKEENKFIDINNEVARLATRRFLEKWRKKFGKSVRHWLVTELGHTGTERIHMHGILWTENKEAIAERWGYGYVWLGKWVNEATINYIVKYISKQDVDHKNYIPKVFTSSRIGSAYFKRDDWKNNKFKGENTIEEYRYRNGTRAAMPMYYRNKIYTEFEREILWKQKLDLKYRYINGVKVSMERSDHENYIETLKLYQEKSEKLGYGKPDWDFEKEELKKLKINTKNYIGAEEMECKDEEQEAEEEGIAFHLRASSLSNAFLDARKGQKSVEFD